MVINLPRVITSGWTTYHVLDLPQLATHVSAYDIIMKSCITSPPTSSVHRQCKGYVETTFRVSSGEKSREVTHFHYTTWPDFATPRTPVGFIDLVHNVGGTQDGTPILVHCSAGLGRSGVFVAVHSSLETQASRQHRVDLETTVREMRKQREGMIQTAEQYRFCFEAVAEALDPLLPPEDVPISQSQSSEMTQFGATPPRPISHPLLGHDTPHTKRYLQDSIPPPPSCPPPNEEPTLAEKRVSSPPPPSSSPPPPLTPSTSVETTPKKVPFLETSPEATPTKHAATAGPDIVVTPPTRRPSLSSVHREFGSADRKLVQKETMSSKEERKESEQGEEGEKETMKSEPVVSVTKSAMKPLATDTSVKIKPEPDLLSQKQQSLKRKKDKVEPLIDEPREDEEGGALSEEELNRTFEGFEVPPPKKEDVEPPNDEGGFEIGDDQVLKAGPPLKMEVKKPEDKPRPKWGRGSLVKQPLAQGLSTGSTKPQKWGQISQTSVPPPVNRGEVERKEIVYKVGKLVIPGAFSVTAKPTTPPPSPERKPVNLVSHPFKPTPVPVREKVTETSQPQETGNTPPVLRIIRKIEARKKTSEPPDRPTLVAEPAKPVMQEPAKPVKQEPPKPDKPVEQDLPPASNVKVLLGRFENRS